MVITSSTIDRTHFTKSGGVAGELKRYYHHIKLISASYTEVDEVGNTMWRINISEQFPREKNLESARKVLKYLLEQDRHEDAAIVTGLKEIIKNLKFSE